MDADTATFISARSTTRTSSQAHRSSSLLIGDSGSYPSYAYAYDGGRGHDSWSSLKKLLVGRRPSEKEKEKYRTLERREPRRLRKKSLSYAVAVGSS
jgi:hypothetical protein